MARLKEVVPASGFIYRRPTATTLDPDLGTCGGRLNPPTHSTTHPTNPLLHRDSCGRRRRVRLGVFGRRADACSTVRPGTHYRSHSRKCCRKPLRSPDLALIAVLCKSA